MTLITRFARLFRADLHAVLDRIEEPDALLRQAIREMEEDLGRDEAQIRALNLEQNRLVGREAELRRTLASLDDEISLCLGAGQEDLARGPVRRKLEAARNLEAIAKRGAETEAGRAALQTRIDENRTLLQAVRAQAEVLGEGRAETSRPGPSGVGADEVEVALLREKQRRNLP